MDLQEIKALIDAMAASDLSEMEVSRNDTMLRLVRRGRCTVAVAPSGAEPPSPAAASASPAMAAPASTEPKMPAATSATVEAPLYGVVHWRPSPDAPPFVEVGQAIAAGQVVCVVEAMKVFNEVRCGRGGTVAALLVASGQEVEAGQALLRLD